MHSSKWMSYLALTVAMITVGSTIVASKLMGGMPVFIAAFVRFAVASPILVALVLVTGARLPRLSRRDWATLCAQAALGSVGYSVLLIAGLSLTQASDASVIAGTLPAVAALLALLVLRERVSRWTVLAIALATLGVGVLSLGGGAANGNTTARWSGNALVLLAMGCEAVFLLLNKTIKTPIAPLVVAAIMAVLSMVCCALPALYQWLHAATPVLSTSGVSAAVYYAVVPTVLGFYLWYLGAATTTGAEAALFTAVYPVAGLLLSAMVLGETIAPQHWVGVAMTVLGIVVGARATATMRQ